MGEIGRLLLLVAATGLGLTLAGGVVVWSMEETRRIRRSLRKVLGAEPHALLIARGRGKGVGFNFVTDRAAVAWDGGAWCLVYRVDELVGAELMIDGQVVGRAYRGEARRAVDRLAGAQAAVRLRLVFADPAYPDFDLDLWLPEDEGRRGALTSADAAHEANRWLARAEALFRRPVARRAAPAVAVAAPPPEAPPAEEPPPWEEDLADSGREGGLTL
jgi:hypothetical protein